MANPSATSPPNAQAPLSMWFRFHGPKWITDAKVRSLTGNERALLTDVFCLRSMGELPRADDAEVAAALHISRAKCNKVKALFLRKGFIDEDWDVSNWDKYQYRSDCSTPRVRAFRERERRAAEQAETENETAMKRFSNVTETPPDPDPDPDLSIQTHTDPPPRGDARARPECVSEKIPGPENETSRSAGETPEPRNGHALPSLIERSESHGEWERRAVTSPQGPGWYPPEFEEAMAVYPPSSREPEPNWRAAWREWRLRMTGGTPPEAMLAGTKGYRARCDAENKTGGQYVWEPKNFFGPDRHFAHYQRFEAEYGARVNPDPEAQAKREREELAASKAQGAAELAAYWRAKLASNPEAGERPRNGAPNGMRSMQAVLESLERQAAAGAHEPRPPEPG
jgi:hypothetical protein